ncbi:MAG: alpha-hydroxy-acid oxidizing protein [Chitinophagaceae bacterium]|nr:alpha-hydroxy-acid oxidizing protein [Chitinophagaceae bacterium]
MIKIQTAFERQREIYIRGIAGQRSDIPFNSAELRAKAKKYVSRAAWDYVDGAASDEATMARNRTALDEYRIIPKMMRNNSAASFSAELFDTRLPAPFLIAPIGALDMVTKRADVKIAAACRQTGTPFIFSNQAGDSMESCATVMGETDRWFQLYWSKSDDLVLSLVKRAEDCGCKAIVLTVDTTMLGWRSRDLSRGYLPFLKAYGIAQYTSDPVFMKYVRSRWEGEVQNDSKPGFTIDTIRHILQLRANYKGPFKEAMRSAQLFTQMYTNPALHWEQVSWLKSKTNLPVIIKGILHPDDAGEAVRAGADGIVVSNHGGRQVNGAVASIDMLPEIRRAVPRPFKILLDSGIRNGSDVFKAIALGADAVLLGRPYVYGLAIAGQQGVESVVRNLQNDFELTARLSGCRSLDEINSTCVHLPG